MSEDLHWFDQEDFPNDINSDEVLKEFIYSWNRNAEIIKTSVISLKSLPLSDEGKSMLMERILDTLTHFQKYVDRTEHYLDKNLKGNNDNA